MVDVTPQLQQLYLGWDTVPGKLLLHVFVDHSNPVPNPEHVQACGCVSPNSASAETGLVLDAVRRRYCAVVLALGARSCRLLVLVLGCLRQPCFSVLSAR